MRAAIRTAMFVVSLLRSLCNQKPSPADQPIEPDTFYRNFVGFSDDQIASTRRGKAIAKILESRTPDEVFVFGSVYIKSTPERYLKLAFDINALRKLPSYLATANPSILRLWSGRLETHARDSSLAVSTGNRLTTGSQDLSGFAVSRYRTRPTSPFFPTLKPPSELLLNRSRNCNSNH